MTVSAFSEVWDLDVIFQGGSHSPEFVEHLDVTKQLIDSFRAEVEEWNPEEDGDFAGTLFHLISSFENTAKKIRQAGAFLSCLKAQNTEDKKALEFDSTVIGLSASFQTVLSSFDGKLAALSQEQWDDVLKNEQIEELAFILTERRERTKEKLSQKEEAVINSLGIDGYHGWGQMYDLIVSNIKIPFTENGEVKQLSVGQAANKYSNSDRNVRREVFIEWEKAWGEHADYLAKVLNHLAGFRLNVYKLRGWDDYLKEPLDLNRMKKETLEAMWNAVEENKQPLKEYLERRAKLMGVEKLSWYDLDAPFGSAESKVPYQEGAQFILEQFAQFGNELTSFSKKALENSWIEAEDRPGKAPGGFHTYFPESNQSRIFMTYSGTSSNISTLAHELGHGFHTYAMRDLHLLNRNYAMNVAETASTFAEMIVSDAAVKKAKTKEEKLALLDEKLQRSVALLMNIHARFLFETMFYEERKQGFVSAGRLNELMEQAQKEAYLGALDEVHPSFWASKLHFFITGVPFYNFPYTFGFLFSMGIYVRALEEGSGFEEKYIALLKDSASMPVEELAEKHLGVDLTKVDFWKKAVDLCTEDVKEFLELTETN
ncbi:M3 family oligoendopeptidase [Neobacillus notoginsengisoli]|uniref:M3 family oligoendopeptidase n=1 Tax=Neobacillus notoginsengisoli TaxID=1578198 RepID=A0A417YUJ2_9BACI|nr:M3 family oligoendopeptidase [Neobacillus notoginsengisoli]RHW40971.1 M3 family oligoendopeptidase [Neobacillus notoginsengisoli]